MLGVERGVEVVGFVRACVCECKCFNEEMQALYLCLQACVVCPGIQMYVYLILY